MAKSVTIALLSTASAPEEYTIPASLEIVPLAVRASFDGTTASGAFYPTLEFISPGGVVVAECPCFTTIAAGGSADVTWFHMTYPQTTSNTLSTYQVAILSTPDVRSYWPLDETGGSTFADLGPSGITLTMFGPPTIGQPPLITTGHSAVFSGAVDGSGFAVQYALSSHGYGTWPSPGSFTVAAWLKTTFSSPNDPEILNSDDGSSRFFAFSLTTAGRLRLTTFYGGTSVNPVCDSTTIVNDGTSRFLVGTFDANTLAQKVYVNGVLEATVAATGSQVIGVSGITLAARNALTVAHPIGGTIDEAALFSRALTATEIANLYSAGQV